MKSTAFHIGFHFAGGVVKKWLGSGYMVKYCLDCHIEIADTSYDTLGRFNAVKYCPECGYKHKLESNRKGRNKRKMERELDELSGLNDLKQSATYSRINKRLVLEQNRLLKNENAALHNEIMRLRAKV